MQLLLKIIGFIILLNASQAFHTPEQFHFLLLIQTSHTFIFLKKKPIFNLIFVKICFHHIPFMLPANITHQTPNK